MGTWTKIGAGAVVCAGVAALVKYVTGLKHTSDELQTNIGAKVLSLDKKGLTVQANVTLKNPTNGSLKMKQPVIEILHGQEVIGTSKVENKDVTLEAFREKALDPIMLTIPFSGLATLTTGLLDLIKKKGPVQLAVKAITSVDLGWTQKNYEQTVPLMMKPKT